MYNTGTQNKYIDKIIKNETDYKFIFYKPYIIDMEVLFTNNILSKIIDKHFEWQSPKIYRNVFGRIQHYDIDTIEDNKFNFEKISEYISNKQSSNITLSRVITKATTNIVNYLQPSTTKILFNRNSTVYINRIPKDRFPYKNIAITNLWIVIHNPTNLKLNDIVNSIQFIYGGMLFQKYDTNNIENQINILAYIFCTDAIKYYNNKIYVPLVIPHNSLIFNESYHDAIIRLDNKILDTNFEVWGNICNANIFPELENTNNFTHHCAFVFYKTQFTGTDSLSTLNNKIKLHFNHPTYVLYIMNIEKKYVTSIKLFVNYYINSNDFVTSNHHEYKLNDIQWFDNHVIIWFNRDFLLLNELNNNLNFSQCSNPYLLIENTYTKTNPIEILALNFEAQIHTSGMTGKCFSD